MTLLEDIQNAAVDANSDLGMILRQCKVLAARLGSKELEDWLIWESNGYPADVKVPSYRIWPLQIKGNFFGPFGSGLRNAPIPIACLPKEARELYLQYECRQSIATLEEMVAKSDGGLVHLSTGDLAVALGTNVYHGQNCLQAWAEFGTGHLVELLNSVRNRILDFVLAIWKEQPTSGESALTGSDAIKPSQVTQIFNTTVYGGSANLVGSANNSVITFNVKPGDFDSLKRVLQESGVVEDDIDDLKIALNTDEKPSSKMKFGPKVSSWIAKMVKKAAEGAWAVGIGAAGNLLADVIARYYGVK